MGFRQGLEQTVLLCTVTTSIGVSCTQSSWYKSKCHSISCLPLFLFFSLSHTHMNLNYACCYCLLKCTIKTKLAWFSKTLRNYDLRHWTHGPYKRFRAEGKSWEAYLTGSEVGTDDRKPRHTVQTIALMLTLTGYHSDVYNHAYFPILNLHGHLYAQSTSDISTQPSWIRIFAYWVLRVKRAV